LGVLADALKHHPADMVFIFKLSGFFEQNENGIFYYSEPPKAKTKNSASAASCLSEGAAGTSSCSQRFFWFLFVSIGKKGQKIIDVGYLELHDRNLFNFFFLVLYNNSCHIIVNQSFKGVGVK